MRYYTASKLKMGASEATKLRDVRSISIYSASIRDWSILLTFASQEPTC
jgi:hypothetical protein